MEQSEQQLASETKDMIQSLGSQENLEVTKGK